MPVILGRELETFRATNFSGGLNVQVSPVVLSGMRENKWLTVATNVVYNADGSVGKRWGMRSVSTSSSLTGAGTHAISGGFQYRKSDGTMYDVIAVDDGTVYKINSNGSLTSIKSGLTSTDAQYTFAVYNDTLFVANGIDAPQQWDGTSWSALGGSSPATLRNVVAHGNRLFGTATAAPSRLYWSKLNNPTDWSGTSDAGFLDVNPNDGGIIATLVPSNQELVILKENRPYRLQGIGPTTGFTVVDNLVPTTGSIGCNSMRGGMFALNDVWYTSPIGVHRLSATQNFGDLTESFASTPIEPYFRYGSSYALNGIQATATNNDLYNPAIVYDPFSNLVIYGDVDAGVELGLDRFLVYDAGTRGWSDWTLPSGMEVTAFWPGRLSSVTGPGVLFLGIYVRATDDSAVYAFDRSQTSDLDTSAAATGISAQVRHVSNLGAAGVEKTPRYLYLYFNKESSSTTMTLNLYADFKTTAVFTTTFDITSTTAETQVVKRIDLGGFTCEHLEVDLSNATAGRSFTFLGYEVKWRPRRTVRRAE